MTLLLAAPGKRTGVCLRYKRTHRFGTGWYQLRLTYVILSGYKHPVTMRRSGHCLRPCGLMVNPFHFSRFYSFIMKTITLIVLAVAYNLILPTTTLAQGCVAVRHMSCATPAGASSADFFKQRTGHWQVSAGYRYFRSFRHYKGDVEQHERLEQHTEVVNLSHALDLGITYMPSLRWSVSVNLPVQYNDRSSLYEHYGNAVAQNPEQKRFHTGSQGIGDLRLSGSYWLVNPVKLPKANLAVGVGVKLPRDG